MSRTVEVRIAGQSYRVVSSAPEEEVRRLAGIVNAKLAEVIPHGKAAPPHALLLAAMSLAYDVEAERAAREKVERRAREVVQSVIGRIDQALENDGAAPTAVG